MSSNPTITLTAKYVWKLVFDYDNTGNSGSIEHSYTLTESGSYTSTTFNENVSTEAKKLAESGSIQLQSGVSYKAISASVTTGYQTSKEVSSFLQNTTREQQEGTTSYSRTELRKYTVGAKSRLVLYQRVFETPGIDVYEQTLKTTPVPLSKEELVEDVPIQLALTANKFVKGLKVVYSDRATDAPGDRVLDWFGGSDDINDTYGGKFVWIVPITTTQVSEALTRFDLVITSTTDSNYDDLSKGAGGKNRYLIPVKQASDLFITELTLARYPTDNYLLLPTAFWPNLPKGYTNDINRGRGGGYLYLVWKLQRAYTI